MEHVTKQFGSLKVIDHEEVGVLKKFMSDAESVRDVENQ